MDNWIVMEVGLVALQKNEETLEKHALPPCHMMPCTSLGFCRESPPVIRSSTDVPHTVLDISAFISVRNKFLLKNKKIKKKRASLANPKEDSGCSFCEAPFFLLFYSEISQYS